MPIPRTGERIGGLASNDDFRRLDPRQLGALAHHRDLPHRGHGIRGANRGERLRQPGLSRKVIAVLVATSLFAWVGYRIASNDRWAARSVAADAISAVPSDAYSPRRGLLTPRLGSFDHAECGVVTTAGGGLGSARPHILVPDLSTNSHEDLLGRAEVTSANLEDKGFNVARAVQAVAGGPWVTIAGERGDQAITVNFFYEEAAVSARAETCASRLLMEQFNDAVVAELEEFHLDLICERQEASAYFAACQG